MPKYIVKLGGYYFEWSTIVDAPVTFGMKLDEFKEYYLLEYGRDGFRRLDRRLERVDKYGTSNREGCTPKNLLSGNRAGPDESELTMAEIHWAYCLQEPIRNGWTVPTTDEKS